MYFSRRRAHEMCRNTLKRLWSFDQSVISKGASPKVRFILKNCFSRCFRYCDNYSTVNNTFQQGCVFALILQRISIKPNHAQTVFLSAGEKNYRDWINFRPVRTCIKALISSSSKTASSPLLKLTFSKRSFSWPEYEMTHLQPGVSAFFQVRACSWDTRVQHT